LDGFAFSARLRSPNCSSRSSVASSAASEGPCACLDPGVFFFGPVWREPGSVFPLIGFLVSALSFSGSRGSFRNPFSLSALRSGPGSRRGARRVGHLSLKFFCFMIVSRVFRVCFSVLTSFLRAGAASLCSRLSSTQSPPDSDALPAGVD